MELNNDFVVNAPIDKAWTVLTDVERIAPCLPGAQLQEIEGDEYRGIVKVKVGPIIAQYKGKAVFLEKNDDEHKAVLKGDGRDTRGAGNASAIITATLESLGDTTKVSVHTDLTVTGKVAQFGRGVMADVSAKLMKQFSDNLEELIASDDGTSDAPVDGTVDGTVEAAAAAESDATATADAATTPEEPKVRKIDMPEAEAVDLLEAAGAPVAKRVAPALLTILIALILRRILGGGGD